MKDELGENAKNYNIVFTGHSLGGTLSELMGAKYGNETVTFNAYGAGQMKGAEINHTNNITNYGNIDDVIYGINKDFHMGKRIYTRDTNQKNGIHLDNHKAENLGDLSKEVHIEKEKEAKHSIFDIFKKDRI